MGSVLGFPGVDPLDAAVGARLKRWREARGMAVEDVAAALRMPVEQARRAQFVDAAGVQPDLRLVPAAGGKNFLQEAEEEEHVGVGRGLRNCCHGHDLELLAFFLIDGKEIDARARSLAVSELAAF